MTKEKKALLIQTTKDTIWWPALVIILLFMKLIFDRTTWESVYVPLLATPFIFLNQYRINKYKLSMKRQMIEWLILVAGIAVLALIVYIRLR